MEPLRIGFIGTGRIGRAIIAGLGRQKDAVMFGYDRDPGAVEAIAAAHPITGCPSPAALAREAKVIILAVKPYQIEEVLIELRPSLSSDHLIVSVAAGISSEFIRKNALEETRVVRVMPNTPAFVGEAMTALCRGKMATEEDIAVARGLFSTIGRVAVLEESQMDAATALSGSGPAYMFNILDSLSEGGVRCGLSKEEALLLGAQTMLGAARMVLSGTRSPEELKREVTTPGGTTEAGLRVMDERGIRAILIDAVAAADARSRELRK
ncbi:pyrroline-5-carboxylate reductase [Pelodictyon luteolum]|uniref:Pyrroline-5-carboxylate reductase n=1 Tax=Chlorobium luteolum (strain DSM 273 / BCRC 81028 / 2530) TaxID=319225 RepID=Q3B6J1_CHLL3|nr:pyrroline-5-carboxylate reductase [Pelodictyon luteolum]ABB23040.1 pyrroline-5-carboxylate reductase [Pelodictyon luteolum DSM 273]